ncbi:MAG: XRE family transcriptional regulator [Cyanobacteria bacterium P01_G01_bin.49]
MEANLDKIELCYKPYLSQTKMFSFSFIREQRQTISLSVENLAILSGIDCAYLSRLEQDCLQSEDPLPTVGLLEQLHNTLTEVSTQKSV